jgi:hypothetical protein
VLSIQGCGVSSMADTWLIAPKMTLQPAERAARSVDLSTPLCVCSLGLAKRKEQIWIDVTAAAEAVGGALLLYLACLFECLSWPAAAGTSVQFQVASAKI